MSSPSDSVIYVCRLCEPSRELDDHSMVLMNMRCPVHGAAWHRVMRRDATGALAVDMAYRHSRKPHIFDQPSILASPPDPKSS